MKNYVSCGLYSAYASAALGESGNGDKTLVHHVQLTPCFYRRKSSILFSIIVNHFSGPKNGTLFCSGQAHAHLVGIVTEVGGLPHITRSLVHIDYLDSNPISSWYAILWASWKVSGNILVGTC